MIKIAIIGAGFMGKTHAGVYAKSEDVQLAAICDKNKELGLAFAEEFHCAYFEDLEEVLEDCDVDVADICVPTFLHEEYTILAAKHKKHIFCEKPVTLSVEKLDRMIAAVKAANVNMYVGQVVRFWPEYMAAKKMYKEGEFGEIKSVYAARLAQHPAWSEWYKKVENSGGGLLDLHLHDIDYMCHLFGKAEYVYSVGRKNSYGCWNHVTSTLTFENGVYATVEGVIEMAQGYPFTMQLRIVGSTKVYEYIMKAGSNLEDVASARRETKVYEKGETTTLALDETDAYEIELLHYIECMKKSEESSVLTLNQVRDVLCTIAAIQKSLETGEKIQIVY